MHENELTFVFDRGKFPRQRNNLLFLFVKSQIKPIHSRIRLSLTATSSLLSTTSVLIKAATQPSMNRSWEKKKSLIRENERFPFDTRLVSRRSITIRLWRISTLEQLDLRVAFRTRRISPSVSFADDAG